jgi:hypothetical protein
VVEEKNRVSLRRSKRVRKPIEETPSIFPGWEDYKTEHRRRNQTISESKHSKAINHVKDHGGDKSHIKGKASRDDASPWARSQGGDVEQEPPLGREAKEEMWNKNREIGE